MNELQIIKEIVENESEDLITYWVNLFDKEEADNEYRYYDDFLSFFDECLNSNLDPHSEEAEALKMFLEKLIELKGEDKFFNFKNSVYTCYLKFPIMKKIEEKGLFNYNIVYKLTTFFEALTSAIIIELLKKNKEIQNATMIELEEREAPIAEIWENVLMVSIVGNLDSNRILKIIDKILNKLENSDTNYVIVDIGAIYDMNSEVARQIIKLNNAIHFMGATSILTGITPSIAKSLTHLDISLGDIKTYSTTKKAMKDIINGNI